MFNVVGVAAGDDRDSIDLWAVLEARLGGGEVVERGVVEQEAVEVHRLRAAEELHRLAQLLLPATEQAAEAGHALRGGGRGPTGSKQGRQRGANDSRTGAMRARVEQ